VKPTCESPDFKMPRSILPLAGGVALASGLAVALILVSVQPELRIGNALHNLVASLVYSCSIAFPATLILIRLGRRRLAQGRSLGLPLRIVVLLGATVAGCMVAGLALVALRFYPMSDYWREFRVAIQVSTVITLSFGLAVSFYRETQARLETAMLELRTRQVEQERAQKLLAEAQLSALESRIHPHFLFNTLNSIAALIPRDPQRAEDMIGKLASLLRFSLNAGQTGLVPLCQELQTVRDYLEIEKARFDTRLSYTIAVAAEAENIGVPPLSVESLVENSIKHVIARRPEGGEIRVSASTQGDRLEIEVSDSGPGFTMDRVPAGHGLDNLSGRLALLFGGEARLESMRNGKYATVRVSIPRKA
jgi:sensor histidine kinase YesM